MPDLANVSDTRTLSVIGNFMVRGTGAETYGHGASFLNFVRLVDQATREYKLARAALARCVSGRTIAWESLIRATDHMENLITALHRAATIIKDDAARQGHDALSNDAFSRLLGLRKSMSQRDDEIAEGTISPDQPIALLVKSDAIELGGYEVYYTELASWLRHLHTIADHLIDGQIAKR
jgi:hypothetical protein